MMRQRKSIQYPLFIDNTDTALYALSLAEMVGFEPTERVTVQTISSRSRYDHIDTSPYLKLL